MLSTVLRQGQIVKLLRDVTFLRYVRKDRYKQHWTAVNGTSGVSYLTPFEAYADGLETAERVCENTKVMIVDWSTRLNNKDAWRQADHLVVQVLYGEKVLYLDVYEGPQWPAEMEVVQEGIL